MLSGGICPVAGCQQRFYQSNLSVGKGTGKSLYTGYPLRAGMDWDTSITSLRSWQWVLVIRALEVITYRHSIL
jgi:hypothetical protein